MSKLTVKRIIPMYSVITEQFKEDFEKDLLEEIKILDNQINATQFQIKQLHTRFGLLANESTKHAQEQINNTILDLTANLEQMANLKTGILSNIEKIKEKPLGEQIETGMFENFVEIQEGDNIIDIFEKPKIVVKDNIIQEIIE